MRIGALLCLFAVATLHAQQPRDLRAPAVGTSSIAGVVANDEIPAKPVRRALVTLAGAGGMLQTVTDDAGRFVFANLAAGRFTLTAEKQGLVKAFYGSKSVGRGPGTAIAIVEGQRITDAFLTLIRGAVIAGTIRDENGRPLASSQVEVYRRSVVNGEPRTDVYSGGTWDHTSDDRGAYRIYGLPPGEYTVSAAAVLAMRSGFSSFAMASNAQIAAVARQTNTALAPGPTPAAAPVADPTYTRSRGYFPDATTAAEAQFITVGAGEERTGVDVRLPLRALRAVRIDAVATGLPARPPGFVSLGLVMPSIEGGMTVASPGDIEIGADGHFTIPMPIESGRYLFVGQATAGPRNSPGVARLFASAEIVVGDENVTNFEVPFLPGISVSGRLVFQGQRAVPAFDGVMVSLAPVGTSAFASFPPSPARVQSDGSFTLTGVSPGRYRIVASGVAGWTLRSAMSGGVDTLDVPLDIRAGQNVSGVTATLIDTPTAITGTLYDQLGRPTPEYAITVFSANRADWTSSRRMSGIVKLGSDGQYSVSGLPPGDYLLAAIVDALPEQIANPAFLEALAAGAIRITLGEGEKKVQDIKLAQ